MEIIETVNISEEEVDKIHLRSNEVNEILGQIPRRIIRYGIGVIAAILILVFAFTFVFKYPDIIYGSFYIQSSNPPAFLLARSSGKLQSMNVSDKEFVEKGQLLAVIENSTGFSSYKYLKDLLDDSLQYKEKKLKSVLNLGELQAPYGNCKKAFDDIKTFKQINYHKKKITSLKIQQAELKNYVKLQKKQVYASRESFKLAQKAFRRDSLLFYSQTIAAAMFEKSQQELVSQKMSLTNTELSLSNSNISLSVLEQQILELELNYSQEYNRLISIRKDAINQLEGALDEWENKYCLISPIKGEISFSGIWEVNQNVSLGQHVMTVLPLKRSKILAKVSIPVSRAGKVKAGQEVNLKLLDFPYNEYGMLVTKLYSISEVPDSAYVGTIFLTDSLVTNYGKHLPFKQNMQGVAEIITEDISLAERLLYPLKEIFKSHF